MLQLFNDGIRHITQHLGDGACCQHKHVELTAFHHPTLSQAHRSNLNDLVLACVQPCGFRIEHHDVASLIGLDKLLHIGTTVVAQKVAGQHGTFDERTHKVVAVGIRCRHA